MKKISFIIAGFSYLISKGISVVIDQKAETEVLRITDSLVDLQRAMNKFKPDYLIVNPKVITVGNKELKRPKKEIIAIGENIENQELKNSFDQYLDIDISQKEIDNWLENLLIPMREKKETLKKTKLTPQEKNVLKHIALGMTNKEIGEKLSISEHTVTVHRKHITQKLEIKSVSGLTVYAIINKFISINQVNA